MTGFAGPTTTKTGTETGTGTGGGLACGDGFCDGTTEYCHEHIIDGPSEFTCEPIPDDCAADPSCDCVVPLTCSEGLQECVEGDDGITVECVEG